MRALVTGASGFVGANLARRLVRDGHDTSLLMRPGFQTWRLEELRTDARVHEADLADRPAIEAILRAVRPDWIFHLAAHGAYSTQTDLAEMLRTNVVGTCTLLSAALDIGFSAFVNTGSSSEYGLKDHAPTEIEALEPNSDYAVTKAAATLYTSHAGRRSDANVATLRLYSVFGPWEEPSRLMPTLIVRGLEGRLPKLASPSIARDFVYVDDVVDAYLLAAAHPEPLAGGVFNVGSGVQTTLAEVVDLARQQFRITGEPEWGSMADRTWDTDVWVSDASLARRTLGWEPSIPLVDGLARFARWLDASDELRESYASRAAH